jgi:hypothetical protein
MAVGMYFEDRFERWLLRRTRGSAWRGAAVTLLLHLVLLVTAFVLIGIGLDVARAADSRSTAGWVTVPGIALLGPFVLYFLPAQFSGFRLHRDSLEQAGATRSEARAITWTGAPFAFLETGIAIGVFFGTFLP